MLKTFRIKVSIFSRCDRAAAKLHWLLTRITVLTFLAAAILWDEGVQLAEDLAAPSEVAPDSVTCVRSASQFKYVPDDVERLKIDSLPKIRRSDVERFTKLRELSLWARPKMDAQDVAEGLEALVRLPSLREITVGAFVPMDAVPSAAFKDSGITSIHYSVFLSPLTLARCSWFRQCTALESLTISNCSIWDHVVYEELTKIAGLKSIDLDISDSDWRDAKGKASVPLNDYYFAKFVLANPDLESIRISQASKLTGAGLMRLGKCKHLRSLYIHGCKELYSELVKHILTNPALHEISLDLLRVPDAGDVAASLRAIAEAPGLTSIALNGLPKAAGSELADVVCRESIEELTITYSDWPAIATPGDQPLKKLHALKSLSLRHVVGFDPGFLKRCTSLASLSVENDATEGEQLAEAIAACGTLESLALRKTSATLSDLARIGSTDSSLRILSIDGLQGPSLNNVSWEWAIEELYCENVDDQAVAMLLEGARPTLRRIELSECTIDEEAIAFLSQCKNVEVISLNNTEFLGESASIAKLARTSTKLRSIDLARFDGLTLAAKKQLQVDFPSVFVMHEAE